MSNSNATDIGFTYAPGTRVFCNAFMWGKIGWGTVVTDTGGRGQVVAVKFDDGTGYRVARVVLSRESFPGQDPHPERGW